MGVYGKRIAVKLLAVLFTVTVALARGASASWPAGTRYNESLHGSRGVTGASAPTLGAAHAVASRRDSDVIGVPFQRVIVGLAATLMEDHFDTNEHFMHTVVQTEAGELVHVDTGSHGKYNGVRIAWRIQDMDVSDSVSAAAVDGFTLDASMSQGKLLEDLSSRIDEFSQVSALPVHGSRLRQLATSYPVRPNAPRSIIAIRVVVENSNGDDVEPSFCDEACVWVRMALF
jgi:hypothetical protein